MRESIVTGSRLLNKPEFITKTRPRFEKRTMEQHKNNITGWINALHDEHCTTDIEKYMGFWRSKHFFFFFMFKNMVDMIRCWAIDRQMLIIDNELATQCLRVYSWGTLDKTTYQKGLVMLRICPMIIKKIVIIIIIKWWVIEHLLRAKFRMNNSILTFRGTYLQT